jgi:hypothetical protein
VVGDRADTGRFSFDGVSLAAIGEPVAPADSHGVWIGLLHVGADGAAWLRAAIAAARADGSLRRGTIAELLMRLRGAGYPIRIVYSRGGWTNVNNVADLVDASGI